jgi:uncharacterized protein (TIGR03435 family)
LVALAIFLFAIAVGQPVGAQSTAAQVANQPPTPHWQIDAGGKMAFDVASVKLSIGSEEQNRNFPLDDTDRYAPNGGLLTINKFPLGTIIAFAYKLPFHESALIQDRLPKALAAERFDIEARASGTPTKDQMRLMMQSLLADRFKLAVHRESRQMPVYALVLARPGKTGPQLVSHSDNAPCGDPARSSASGGSSANVCSLLSIRMMADGFHLSIQNVTMQYIADTLPTIPGVDLDRPLLDQTGLAGRFDVTLVWTPELRPGAEVPPDVELPPAGSGPTSLEALNDQLGLKLDPQTGPVDVLVIDRVVEPSPN